MLSRRSFVAAGATLLPFASARAQSPAMAKILVGFPPGGGSDVIARAVADQIRGNYAGTVLVDNKPGAAARIAAEAVKAAAPDGQTMLLTPAAVLTLYPHVYKELRYDPFKDFTPVTAVSSTQLAMFAGPAVPQKVTTVPELVQWLKANPKLGTFGSPALGSAPHLTGLMFGKLAGVELLPVAYQGAAPATLALLAGEVALSFGSISDGIEYVRSGKLRLLATTGEKRSLHVPTAPTFAETGFPDLVIEDWHSILLPAKAPAAVVARLHEAVRKAVATPPVQSTLNRFAFEPLANSPEDFARILRTEHERWARIVRTLKFSME
ncbi:tripartite tricarboxylate transporter substrate-binding protein [Ramlibacter agri]|nr:tripartite tricarboxylate transporter substrate-binding protein [Ramlibacter agri]